MSLSPEALQVLLLTFSANNMQFPASLAEQIVEIRRWAEAELKRPPKDKPASKP